MVCLIFWHTVICQFMQLLHSKVMCNTVFDAHFCYFFGLTALITLKYVTQLTFIPFISTIYKS